MIKLISARIQNFRQLRNIQLQFALEPNKPLTVIRAENGTGKTTLLTALAWGLFGNYALPRGRSAYQIQPLDWDVENHTYCPISVEIGFSTIDDEVGVERHYKLIRSTSELTSMAGKMDNQPTTLTLFEQKAQGDTVVNNPRAFIENRILPKSLKDIFFIDGDRALVFIETTDTRSVRRERVEKAVRQLLGLDILEQAEKHVAIARREALRKVRKQAQGTNLESLAEREELMNTELQSYKEQLSQLNDDIAATETRKRKAEEALHEALAAGGADHQQLKETLTSKEGQLEDARKHSLELTERQRELINQSDLLAKISMNHIRQAGELLVQLESEGVIPDTLPEVVQDRLDRGTCICGRDISEGTEGHTMLKSIVQHAGHLQESQGILMFLNNSITLSAGGNDFDWTIQAKNTLDDLVQNQKILDTLERETKELDTKIDSILDKDISQLQIEKNKNDADVRRLNSEEAQIRERIKNIESELTKVAKERQALQRKERKYRRLTAEENTAMDILTVIKDTINVLQSETIDEVSSRMNDIFLKMIVADPEAGGLIKCAKLTHKHDIQIISSEDQFIDPDIALSGAQRRALTLAFILALVKVSGVRAPSIVDTPLGMTSSFVRQALLQYTIENSPQLVMFLTESEIYGVEKVLDKYTGTSYTMTFTNDYPKQLVNDPNTGRKETLLCDCDYKSVCTLCKRKDQA